MNTNATAPAGVVSSTELGCVSLWSQDVFWLTMPDGAQICLRKNWVPGPSTVMGSWVWSISAQNYPQPAAEHRS